MINWYTAKQEAKHLGISITLLQQLTWTRKLPVYHLGARVVYDPEEVDQVIKEQMKQEAVRPLNSEKLAVAIGSNYAGKRH